MEDQPPQKLLLAALIIGIGQRKGEAVCGSVT